MIFRINHRWLPILLNHLKLFGALWIGQFFNIWASEDCVEMTSSRKA